MGLRRSQRRVLGKCGSNHSVPSHYGVLDAETAKTALDGLKNSIITNFDALFIWAGNIFVIFCLILIVSPYGKIRLGGKDATTDYSLLSWIAMLFAAGMGIGLMFWSVAEPWLTLQVGSIPRLT